MQSAINYPLLIIEQVAADLDIDFAPNEFEASVAGLDALPEMAEDLISKLSALGSELHLEFVLHDIRLAELDDVIDNATLPLIIYLEGSDESPKLVQSIDRNSVVFFDMQPEGLRQRKLGRQAFARLMREALPPDGDLKFISVLNASPILSQRGAAEDSEHELTPVRRLWNLMMADRRDLVYILIYAIAIGLLSLALPLGIQAIINLISGGVIASQVVLLIVFVILAVLFTGIMQIFQLRIVEILQQRIFTRAAFEFVFRVPRLRMEAITEKYAPELMNRFFDVPMIQKGFSKLFMDFFTSLLNIFFGLLLLTFYHPFFVFFDLMLIITMVIIFRWTGKRALDTSIAESTNKYKVAAWLQEIARTMSAFKLAGFTNLAMNRMDGHVSEYLKRRKQHFRVLIEQYATMTVFKTLVTGGVLIVGTNLVVNREITLGQFVASEIVVISVVQGVEKIFLTLDIIYDLLTAVHKVGQITDLPLEPNRGVRIETDRTTAMGIQTHHLSYHYAHNQMAGITNISLEMKAGKHIGVIGPRGSGKHTLMRVLSGQLFNYSGGIEIDGLALRDINVMSLRDQVGQTVDHPELFEGTIFDNIAMGKLRITLDDVKWALEQVGIDNYSTVFPNGLQTKIVNGGRQFNEDTVKQLLLARAIVERPRLLLIDEDYLPYGKVSRDSVMQSICSQENEWTLVVLCTTRDMVARCDKIIGIADGSKQYEGDYQSLLDQPDLEYLLPLI